MANTYKLIMKSGPDEGTEVNLDKDEMFLGRDENNDIVIKDAEVSRRHARLLKQEDDFFYEDLGSTNGSFIGGAKLSTLTLLHPGAVISIGDKVMVEYSMTVDPSATVVSPRVQVPRMTMPPVYVQPVEETPPVLKAPPPMPVPAPVSSADRKTKLKKILIIVAAVLLVFCVIPWIIMEISDSYCSLFGWFFNAIKPGSCPVF